MCYKSPGPRCSAYAKKKLFEATAYQKTLSIFETAPEEYATAKEAVRQAELEYDATPAGQKYLALRVEQGMDSKGEYAERLANGKKMRRMQLKAIESKESGDINDHPEIFRVWESGVHQESHILRESWDASGEVDTSRAKQYESISLSAAQILSPDEQSSLMWVTSDGGPFINSKLAASSRSTLSEKWTWGNTSEPFQRENYTKEFTQKKIRHLNSAFKAYSLEQPAVLYRGLNDWSLPDQLAERNVEPAVVRQYLEEKYPVGSTITVPEYMSTSADPKVANKFTGSTSIILEVKTKQAIPVGYMSTWGTSEREFVVNKGQKYKVHAILEDVEFAGLDRKGESVKRKATVVQLEQV